ncbi:MAG: ABC transporter permease [Bacteroidota bacterium]
MTPESPISPPRLAQRFLEWFIREDLAEEVLGDLEEQFLVVLEEQSLVKAKLNYWYQVLNYLRPFAIRAFKQTHIMPVAMYQHYVKISWRNLLRNKVYSILNISGLAVGMACSILIFLWIQHELSYDQFHPHAENIYRLNAVAGGGEFKAAVSPAGMAEGLREEMPEIHSTLRLGGFDRRMAIFETEKEKYIEDDIFFADSNFLQFFDFPLIEGDKRTALYQPNGILLTESTAKKYFGDKEALGQTIMKDNQSPCIITGILADLPSHSHLQFSMILPLEMIAQTDPDLRNNVWDNFGFYSYIRFHEQAVNSPQKLKELVATIDKIYLDRSEQEIVFQLQALTDIHLKSEQQFDVPGHGNMQYVQILFLVAIFILLVACINFMNLATARSAHRSKEIGLRKVVGAKRSQLISQFLSESLIVSFLSIIIAVGLVYVLLPSFNDLSGKTLSFSLTKGPVWMGLGIIGLFTGLLSGSYPALFLSKFKPVQVLKGKRMMKGGNRAFRNGLVVTQFVVSLLMLIGTAVVYNQLHFIKNKHLGYDKSNLLYFPLSTELRNDKTSLESALMQNPLTSDFSLISELPAHLTSGALDLQWEGRDPNLQIVIPSIAVDDHFLEVFQIELLSGRGFSRSYSTDQSNFVVNETAVRLMGMTVENAVGKTISFQGQKGLIVGVVKDFHFKPLQYAIEPLILWWNKFYTGNGYAVVRAPARNTESTIEALKSIHTQLNPAVPLLYHFLDQDLDNQYEGEQQVGQICKLFAILAIFISCLGLYGLSAFMAEQRTKEIGIRKVLGANALGLVSLLSRDFFKLIAFALLLAIPIGWLLMREWLDGFAYRTEVSWWMLVGITLGLMLIAFLTVSHQVIKTALTNPVESLRSE